MLAVAATMLAGANGFGVAPSFAVRQVRWLLDAVETLRLLRLIWRRKRGTDVCQRLSDIFRFCTGFAVDSSCVVCFLQHENIL